MDNRECLIYAEQLILGYRRYGQLCQALEACREVLPEKGELSSALDACLQSLLTGEGAAEDDPVRSALRTLENGDIRLTLIHDVIAESIETGRDCEVALRLLEESLEPSFGEYRPVPKETKGKVRSRRKAVERELCGWMLSMVVYRSMGDFREAVRRSMFAVHGFFREQLRGLVKQLEYGDPAELCRHFLSELSIREIRLCLMVCLQGGEEEWRTVLSACRRMCPGQVLHKNTTLRKGVAAAALAVVMVVLMTGVTGVCDAKKEEHLREALTGAMSVTVGESLQITETNQMLAIFMQNMLKNVDDDIDLTVRICEMDEQKKTMDVEAVGEYDLGLGRRSVRVRRRVAF